MCQPVINCDHVMSRFALTDLEGSLRVCVCVCGGMFFIVCVFLKIMHCSTSLLITSDVIGTPCVLV